MNKAKDPERQDSIGAGFTGAMLESIGSPALIVERASGRIRAANPAAAVTLNLSASQLIGSSYRKVEPGFDASKVVQPKYVVSDPDGAPVEPVGEPGRWHTGDDTQIDVTRQVFTSDDEELLLIKAVTHSPLITVSDLPAWLTMIVEELPDTVRYANIDEPCKSLYINPAGLRLMGVGSTEDANSRRFSEFFGPGGEDLYRERIVPYVRTGRVWEGDATIRNVSTGQATPVVKRVYPIKEPRTGQIKTLCAISRDVSKRNAAERQAWMLRSVIENMPASILILSPDTSLTPLYANAACFSINDVKNLEELAEHLAAERASNAGLIQFVEERIPAALEGKSMVYASTTTNRTTGAVTPVQRVLFPIYDVDGRHVEAVGSISVDVRNIANRAQRLEGELANKVALVEAVQHMYGVEKRRADHLNTVQQISTRASTLFDTDEMLRYFGQSIRELFGYYLVAIYSVDPETNELELRAIDGDGDGPDLVGDRVPVDAQSLAGWVASFGTEMEIEDTGKDLHYVPIEGWEETRSQFLIPIAHSNTVLGVLSLQSRTPGYLDDIDKTAARILADRIAVNIENARLFQQTREHGVLAERNRLAREIHDSLAQRLSEIHWQMRALEQRLLDSNVSEKDREAVSTVANLAQESLAEARRSVWDLTTRELDRHSLAEALEVLVNKAGADAKLKTIFDASGYSGYFLPGIESALLRICQEAVNNAISHAGASELRVTLRSTETQLELMVQDNGRGFDPARVPAPSQTNGYGLTSIRERVRLAGGTVTINSRPGGGTVITTIIPVPMKKRAK